MSLMYSGTYGGFTRNSGLSAPSQSLSLSANRQLSNRWSATLSGTGQDTTLAQFLFQPSTSNVITGSAATFDDFAAAFSVGQFSNAQIASTLTGSPILQSPAQGLVLGDRILSYSAEAKLSFAYSSRLTFHISSLTAAGQHRTGGQEGSGGQNGIIPRSIGGDAGVGLSYSLSPRTDVGGNIVENVVRNSFQKSYGTTATGFVGRKMGMRWFVRAYGGGSLNQITQTYGTPRTQQMVGGGTLGFRTFAHTFATSYDRSSTDVYGFAVGSNTSIMASWNWYRRGGRYRISSAFGQQQIRNTGFASISGWQSSSGWTTNLTDRTSVTAQYVYLQSAGNYLGRLNELTVHSVRVSLNWTPQPVQR